MAALQNIESIASVIGAAINATVSINLGVYWTISQRAWVFQHYKKTKEARSSVKFGRILTDSQIHDS